jgi:two-component system, NarL family, nitrate/nitrite response regulator NarL
MHTQLTSYTAYTVPSPIRVLIVDDHAVVRAGLAMLLESHPGLQLTGEAGYPADALTIATREQPDIVVLDLDLGGESGLDLLPKLRAAAPNSRVILLTGLRDPEQHREAVQRGAMGVVLKDQVADVLLNAIDKVYSGEAWLDPFMVASLITGLSHQHDGHAKPDSEATRIASLTEREREVIRLICEGLSNHRIGQRLSISEKTVRHHLSSVYAKLELDSRLQLVIYAHRHTDGQGF